MQYRLMQPSLCKVTEDAPPSEQSSLVLGDKLPDNRPAAQQSTACLPARKTSSEDFSWVDKIIRNQQTVLQNEKDIVGQGDEDAIEGLIDKRNLSRVASLIAEKALCNQFRGLNDQLDDLCSDDQSHKNLPSAKPRPSDYSFVDQIINDKVTECLDKLKLQFVGILKASFLPERRTAKGTERYL